MSSPFTFLIEQTLFSTHADADGWNLELNLISWQGRKPTYDLRKWTEDHLRMSKGVTLSEDEVILLFQKAPEILEAITGDGTTQSTISPTPAH